MFAYRGFDMNRRAFLSVVSASCCGATAGCLGDRTETDRTNDETDGPDQDASRGPYFEIREVVEPADPVGLSVRLQEYADPVGIEIYVSNESSTEHTFEFDGFRPFPDPWAVDDNDVRRFVLVPGAGTLTSYEDEYLPDEPPEDHYWEPTRPVELPDGEQSYTFEPGESIGGKHHLLTAHGASEYTTQHPKGGAYRFDSTIGVPTADVETVELGFVLSIKYADP